MCEEDWRVAGEVVRGEARRSHLPEEQESTGGRIMLGKRTSDVKL